VSKSLSILLLHGEAEARLLEDAELAIQAVLPAREVQFVKAWATRPSWLDPEAPPPPQPLRGRGLIPDVDVRDLLQQPHRLVVFSLLPFVATRALKHRSGGVFLVHRPLVAAWSSEDAALVESECAEEPVLSPAAAAEALERVIERLHERGSVVAVCTAFRHVREPLQHRTVPGQPSLRELVRRTNLEAARLSQRTGCFVLDLDRPFAQEGGEPLGADCFGGSGRAAEIALDELGALILDALPDDAAGLEEA